MGRLYCSCILCKESVSTNNLAKHHNRCLVKGSKFKISGVWDGNLICIYCGKECSNRNSISQHTIRCKLNPNRIISIFNPLTNKRNTGKKGKNQYIKAKELGLPKPELSLETRTKLSKASMGKIWDSAARERQSKIMLEVAKNNPESYSSSNRGRVKQIEFDGIKFQGSWEVDFYKWAISEKYTISRVVDGFPYEYEGKIRTYYPDFYIKELDLYIEVKGYETEKDKAKWESFPFKLSIIRKKELQQIKKQIFVGF